MENGLHRLTLPLLDHLVNESISDLAQYSGLVLTICLVVVFLVRFYVFEAFLMERLYGEKYTNMTNESVRRGFVNHHVATLIKLVLFVTAGYPFIAVMGGAKMHSPYNGQGGQVTMGDVLVVCSQLFVTMYTFELFYRSKISLVSALHHMGAIIIAESAVAMSLDFEHHKVDSAIEFMLCFVWGAFDVLAELWPHLAIILYRLFPEKHAFLLRIFCAACYTELASTMIETAVVMWLFAGLWQRWTLAIKIATPILHVVFSAAQLWGAIIFRRMWKRQGKLLAEEKRMIQSSEVSLSRSSEQKESTGVEEQSVSDASGSA